MSHAGVDRRDFLKTTVGLAAAMAAFPAVLSAAGPGSLPHPGRGPIRRPPRAATPGRRARSSRRTRCSSSPSSASITGTSTRRPTPSSAPGANWRGSTRKNPSWSRRSASSFRSRRPRGARPRCSRIPSVKLVVSAAIPDERGPLGIRVMQHGKDFMSDKPGMTTIEQLAEIRRVQAETKRIYSIMYSERLENRATVKAGELVKAGAIGRVVQTVGLGPHRMTPSPARPGSSSAHGTAASCATSPRTRRISSCSSPARRRPKWSHRRSEI